MRSDRKRELQMDKKIFVTRSSMPPYEEYIEAIRPLWDSRHLTNMGAYHRELEEKLKQYLDVPWLSLMVNGHMALELVIQAFEFPEGSEIITTPFTFISTTHAIIRNRLKPVFCDVKACDGTMDEAKIESLITERTAAILPVHVYGNPCNVEEIKRIADKYNLKVIYDAAHAFGITYKGRGIGNYGDASIFSFHATKVYNTIEGGAVTFQDHRLYEKLYNLKNFGIRGEEWVCEVGANGKMNEFCAVMGLLNLKRAEYVMWERKKRADSYIRNLKDTDGIRILKQSGKQQDNYGYFPILIEKEYRSRDEVYTALKNQNIYARKYFYPLTSDQECFKNKFKEAKLDTARELAEQVLVLPLYEQLDMTDVEKICSIITAKDMIIK